MRVSRLAALAVIALLAGAAGTYAFFRLGSSTSTSTPICPSNYSGGGPLRSQLTPETNGHITQFKLQGTSRALNGITTAPDGSVWFGEESMPALGHLFQNGTLLEYVWPGTYPPSSASDYSCGYRTQIWGVALWNGSVWASDSSGNDLVNLNPGTGQFHFYTLSPNSFPYHVVAGLDGRLWFTELFAPALVSLDQNGTAHTYLLPTGFFGTPTQIYFVNSTYALYADAGQSGSKNGGVYGFDPDHPVFNRVGGSRELGGVTGLAIASGGLWISEHGPTYIDFYNLTSSSWTDFPTSVVPYSYTTLPYFIKSDGVHVWFNEHYGDRIAEIDASEHMIEYAISNPPAGNLSSISASQTIARDGEKIWFAEFSRNTVGFADFSYPPAFSLMALSPQGISLKPGGSATLPFELQGSSSSPVQLMFSDSETTSAIPVNLTASATSDQFANLTAGVRFTLGIRAGLTLPPGEYIFDVTASNLFEAYTIFLRVDVT